VLIYIYSTQEKKEKKKRTTQLAIVVCLREEERKKNKKTFRLCKFPTAFTAVKGAVGSDDDER
jgi:hypothetical protein